MFLVQKMGMRQICGNLEPGDSSTVRAVVGELALVSQPLSHPAQLLGSRIKEQNMITFSANSKKHVCMANAEKAHRVSRSRINEQ